MPVPPIPRPPQHRRAALLAAVVAAGPAMADPALHADGFAHFCIETGAEIEAVEARAVAIDGRRVSVADNLPGQVIGFAFGHATAGAFLLSAQTVVQGGKTDRQCVLMRPDADPRMLEAELRRRPGFGAPFNRIESGDNTYTLWNVDGLVPGGEVALIERTRRDNPSVTLSLQRITEAGG